jgi:hypothetical protein
MSRRFAACATVHWSLISRQENPGHSAAKRFLCCSAQPSLRPGAVSKRNAKEERTAHSIGLSVPSENARDEKSASMEGNGSFLARKKAIAGH